MTKEEKKAASTAFDAGIFEFEDTAEMTVRHPITDQPTTWVWTIAGPGHPVTVEQGTRLSRKVLNENRAKEQAMVNGRKWKGDDREPEEIRRENAETFAERVLGWTEVTINGEPYGYSRENVVKLLMNPRYGRIYTQLLDFLRADENFMKGSAQG